MAENWLNPDVLCSFDELVRVEIGPQIIELDCTDENLRDEVTSPHYKIGARDAYGKVIRPDEAADPMDPTGFGIVKKGEKMHVVDWRAKHVPHVWKVYTWVLTPDDETIMRPDPEDPEVMVCINPGRFIKCEEFEDRETALDHARDLRGTM